VSKSCGTIVGVVAQRRRGRSLVAMSVAPKVSRPQALRDLYTDAGTVIRRAAAAEAAASSANEANSRSK
jgi:hypothetical protein